MKSLIAVAALVLAMPALAAKGPQCEPKCKRTAEKCVEVATKALGEKASASAKAEMKKMCLQGETKCVERCRKG